MSGFIPKKIYIINSQIDGDVNFIDAIFDEEVHFNNIVFNGTVSFNKSKFMKIADFDNSNFRKFTYWGTKFFMMDHFVILRSTIKSILSGQFSMDIQTLTNLSSKKMLFSVMLGSTHILFLRVLNSVK